MDAATTPIPMSRNDFLVAEMEVEESGLGLLLFGFEWEKLNLAFVVVVVMATEDEIAISFADDGWDMMMLSTELSYLSEIWEFEASRIFCMA